MAQFKVGSRTAPGSTGSEAITGLGFQPKAIIFWGNGANDGTVSANMTFFRGFSDGTNNDVRRDSKVDNIEDTTGIINGATTSYCIAQVTHDGVSSTTLAEAAITSFDTDGFTLNWVTRTANFHYSYLAIGGDEVEAFVGRFTTGSGTGPRSTTGVGFEPSCLFFIPLYFTNFGVAGDDLNGVGNNWWSDGAAPNPVIKGRQQTTYPIFAANTSDTVDLAATLTSYDSDGFTYNRVTNNQADVTVVFLALKGVACRTGVANKPTSATTQSITGLPFPPEAVVVGSFGHAASANSVNDVKISLGASDGTTEACTHGTLDSGLTTTEANNIFSTSKIIQIQAAESGTALQGSADMTGFTSSGFDLDWTTSDATAREFWYAAFGPDTVPGASSRMLLLGVG